jgi:hypothetical protein
MARRLIGRLMGRMMGRELAIRPIVLRRLRRMPSLPFTMLVHLLYQREFTAFRNPKSFSQRLAHKKLYDRNPLYVLTADKYLARDYVSQRIGEQHLVPLLQVAERGEDLLLDRLKPPYVIKSTHGYDMNVFVHGRDDIDVGHIHRTTNRWLRTNHYENWHEWAYKDARSRLVVEEFIGSNGVAPTDYKFWTFHGKVQIIQVDVNRFTDHQSNMVDRDWNPLDVHVKYRCAEPPPPPANIGHMIEIAEKLAVEFELVRVDLYSVADSIYFGEFTHYPGGGCIRFMPHSFDVAMGEMWATGGDLPADFLLQR